MNSHTDETIATLIIQKAKAFGASLAGIVPVASLENAPSYEICANVEWPEEAKSLLVLALVHEISEPELDWWDDRPGGTPGNRQLGSIAKSLTQWLKEEFDIDARPLPYHVENGGIFLKDAAALAGLGCIGRNNLLITQEFGPRVRFRALFLDVDLQPTGPIDFSPCETCDMPCRRMCPRKAFSNGSYRRAPCNEQMKEDVANKVVLEESNHDDSPSICIKYCRSCELACPVAT